MARPFGVSIPMPVGVQPKHLETQPPHRVEMRKHIGLAVRHNPVRDRRRDQLPFAPGQDVREHHSPELVAGFFSVLPGPIKLENPRAADRLARMQPQVG